MNGTRLRGVALLLGCFSISANAGTLSMWTFGGDLSPGGNGSPDSLNGMNPASSASVTNVQTPVGDGNTGFNGGLVAFNSLLSATTLYDTQIPLAQNAGIALIPEPAPGTEIGAGLALLSLILRRAAIAALPKRHTGCR